WTNGSGYVAAAVNGNGAVLVQQPHLIQPDGSTIVLVTNGTNSRFFHEHTIVLDEGQRTYWSEDYYGGDTIAFGNGQITVTDPGGNALRFLDFGTSTPTSEQGTFQSYTDRAGNAVAVVSRDAAGRITEVQRSNTTNGVT